VLIGILEKPSAQAMKVLDLINEFFCDRPVAVNHLAYVSPISESEQATKHGLAPFYSGEFSEALLPPLLFAVFTHFLSVAFAKGALAIACL
jgi:hypothetical protein